MWNRKGRETWVAGAGEEVPEAGPAAWAGRAAQPAKMCFSSCTRPGEVRAHLGVEIHRQQGAAVLVQQAGRLLRVLLLQHSALQPGGHGRRLASPGHLVLHNLLGEESCT